MRMYFLICFLCAVNAESQFWNGNFFPAWLRVAKSTNSRETTPSPIGTDITKITTTVTTSEKTTTITDSTTGGIKNKITTTGTPTAGSTATPTKVRNITPASTTPVTASTEKSTQVLSTSTVSEGSTFEDTTISETITTEEEPRDNSRTHEFYLSKRNKPQIKISTNISQNLLPLPAGASAALIKPTKYHYYPHNQHIYLLPECAIQQVCNAVYVRLNWTQPLCACPSRYRDPCSASLNTDDQHTTELMTEKYSKKALTLVKTCEPTAEMRVCRPPRDWSLLALQNIRTGKSHYLVICRCQEPNLLEGPMSHDQPTYASVPGIRVFGMMCVENKRKGRPLRSSRSLENPPFPWDKAMEIMKTASWD